MSGGRVLGNFGGGQRTSCMFAIFVKVPCQRSKMLSLPFLFYSTTDLRMNAYLFEDGIGSTLHHNLCFSSSVLRTLRVLAVPLLCSQALFVERSAQLFLHEDVNTSECMHSSEAGVR